MAKTMAAAQGHLGIDDMRSRFQQVFDCAPVGMLIKDIDNRRWQVNAALRDMLGYDAAEWARIGMSGLLHPEDRLFCDALCNELVSGKRDAYQIEARYRHKAGHELWCKVDVALARDAGGQPQLAIATLEDISARRRLDVLKRHMISRYEQVVKVSGWGICEIDRRGAIIFVNPAAAAMLGWRIEELIGKSILSVYRASGMDVDGTQVCGAIRGALNDGLTRRCDHDIFHCKDGSSVVVEYTVTPMVDGQSVNGATIVFKNTGG